MGLCLNRLFYNDVDGVVTEIQFHRSKRRICKIPDVQITKEHQRVQPRSTSISSRGSISTMSRGSIKSDPFTCNEETSSISARSDTSVDSYVFDPSFGAIRPDLYPRKDAVLQQSSLDRSFGRLHVRLKYDFRTSDLVVHLIEAQDLPPSERLEPDVGSGDPYIKVSLEPTVDERVRQSSVKRKTANPFYNEYFKFPATYDDIKESSLVFMVYDYDKFSRHKLMGEVRIDLSKVETSNSVEMWCDVQKQHQESAELGEVLLSLSYLPTAERLTVVVMKAKDLRVPTTTPSSDPYVRITLVVEGKKVKRKKTSVKKGTHNPVWNEALSFNIPPELLPKVTLECHVVDNDLIGHGEFVGCVMIGQTRAGNEGKHWGEMMQNQRKSIAMWHPLHR
ncbi:synaptotagmin-6-like isoform X2 [Dreissena polymorpha]|uniref:synaptotagmin-6-like isoform X2 n=1 Tax=Dreissena polymorpha TaxID=45954 RepID=UPI002264E96E|nr:synaptotagmin-6-like isoform X2 [Dreissena polymorpha]